MSRASIGYTRRKSGGAIFFLFALGVFLTLGLYFVKTRAQTAKAEAFGLERQLKAEEAEILKLKSELAHLENPARVEKLAGEVLTMGKIEVEQVIGFDELDERFPVQDKEETP